MPKRPKESPDPSPYKGIIIGRAKHFYFMLPAHHRAAIDWDDWIAEGMMFGIRVLSKHNSKRGMPTTLIHTALQNFYHNWYLQLTNTKRGAETVSFEVLVRELEGVAERVLTDIIDSERLVKRMHTMASNELLAFLDDHFFHQNPNIRVQVKTLRFKMLCKEFREIAKRLGVTIDHYRIAIALHHARSHALQ